MIGSVSGSCPAAPAAVRKVSMVSRIVSHSKITRVSPTPSRPARSVAAGEPAPAISRGPPDRFRADIGFGDAVETALETHRVRTPDGSHGQNVFLEPRAAPLHRDARGLEFLLHPALADPDDEPTVAEPIERREPAREDDRALEECIEHAGT